MKYGGLLAAGLGCCHHNLLAPLHNQVRSFPAESIQHLPGRLPNCLVGGAVICYCLLICIQLQLSQHLISCQHKPCPCPRTTQDGFLSLDAMTVHSETSACSTMFHREVSPLPHHPPPTSHQEERCSHLPLDTADTHGMMGVWSRLCSARPPGFLELRGCWPAPAALWAATGNSFFTSAVCRSEAAALLVILVPSHHGRGATAAVLQCCTACSYLSIFSLHCSISPSSIHRLQYCSTSISEPSLNHSQCRHSRGSQAAADG